ncbi:MAG: glutaredoxin family protein [Vulcanimicrobiota bacterium]
MVKVYTTPTCPHCIQLIHFLDRNNIDYTNINILKDREGLRNLKAKTGQIGVPVTEIDTRIIIGYNEKKIEEALLDQVNKGK